MTTINSPKPQNNKKNNPLYWVSILISILFVLLIYFLQKSLLSITFISIIPGVCISALLIILTRCFQRKLQDIHEHQEKKLSLLKHDVKGILSPALLMADRIALNKSADEKTIHSAESIVESIEKVAQYLTNYKVK